MKKIWAKTDSKLNPVVEAYTVGTDYLFDQVLLPYDVEASKVHALGLVSIGILTQEEFDNLFSKLDELLEQHTDGEIVISPSDEDCHTVIENYLINELGDVGKKIHTGRSRNDQVLVAMRLYMLEAIANIAEFTLSIAAQCKTFALQHEAVPLPGYTHTQQAMLSSVGHYGLSLTESLLDDVDLLLATYAQLNKNPLGSAAGFGVSLPLDRELTTKELGFRSVQINSLYCQKCPREV